MRRLFFALWPPASVAGQLHDAALLAQRACGGRAMRRDSLHVTLAFLGTVPEARIADAEAAAEAVSGASFDLDLDRLACWKHNRIAWAGCAAVPPALSDLADALSRHLRGRGFTLDKRAFAVHATLVRSADCAAALPVLDGSIRWPVDAFCLVESRLDAGGARYHVMRRWALD